MNSQKADYRYMHLEFLHDVSFITIDEQLQWN